MLKKKVRRKIFVFSILLIILTLIFIFNHLTNIDFSSNGSNTKTKSETLKELENQENKLKLLNDWRLILVNKNNLLPENFNVELKNITRSHKVDARIYDELHKMLKDATNQNINLLIVSGYRDFETSQKLYNQQVNQFLQKGYEKLNAEIEAAKWVAPAGTSEHHTGLAVDIVAETYQVLNHDFGKTKEAIWLKENASKYGFILRYPEDKQYITGITYEPWHFRYVGIEHAEKIKNANLCLEEYLS